MLTNAEPWSPWPFLGEWVQYKDMIGDTYIFQCLSCLPKITELKVNKSTKANLKSHFNRIHPNKAKQVNEACVANVGTGGRTRNRLPDGRSPYKKQRQMAVAETLDMVAQGSGILHPTIDKHRQMPITEPFNVMAQGTTIPHPTVDKQWQTSTAQTFDMMAQGTTVLHPTVTETVIRFVVDNMLPLHIVDSLSFRDMVHTLNPSTEVPSRRTLGRRILQTYEEMKERLISKLEQVKWVGSTADGWSADNIEYLGMSVHWLDPHTRARKMGVLACERIMGSHTHEGLAQVIHNIHSQFGIQDKVTMITTDNAANFQEAFTQFPSALDDHQEEESHTPESAAHLEELITDSPEGQGNLQLQFITIDGLGKATEDGINKLPRQHKCAAHTLHLVATTDSDMTEPFTKAYRSAIAKAQALWNKQGTSTVFADSLYKAINRRLTVPTKTKWSSFHDSLVVLNTVLEEKKNLLHSCINQEKDLTMFIQEDIDFMAEYAKVMAPVVEALDHIQRERQSYLGCLIPILIVTKKKLLNLMISGNLQFCEPLVHTLLAAVEKRFTTTFQDEECLLATAFHPKFRLKWMAASESDERMVKMSEVKSLMERKVEELLQHTDMETEDYYASIWDEEDNIGDHHIHKSKAAQIVNEWLVAKGTESLASPAFNNEEALSNLFLRYNTAMPSSGAVERLFSLSKDIMKAKGSSLSDKNFNILMFMKGNRAHIHQELGFHPKTRPTFPKEASYQARDPKASS